MKMSNAVSHRRILKMMEAHGAPLTPEIEILESVDSTNTLLKDRAMHGAPHGKVVIALSQTAGRGRMGRSFYSPEGSGLYISILLRPEMTASDALMLTPMTAVACLRALRASGCEGAGIKWVNDILISGKKAAGILVEGAPDGCGGISYAVVGIGINLVSPEGGFPEPIKNIACGAFDGISGKIDRDRLVSDLLCEFFSFYSRLPNTEFMKEYRAESCIVGKSVTLTDGECRYSGIVSDIDCGARIVLSCEDGETRVFGSGEATLKT